MRCTLGFIAFLVTGVAWAQQTAAPAGAQIAKIAPLRCAEPIARIASVQGSVELRGITVSSWERAQLNDALCLNDSIRVGANSRASFQYTSDITVQLDQNTFITLVEAKDKASIWTQMWRGALHFITRSRKPYRVITPFANASVEGTEVYISLGSDRADMTVFEGKLDVANDAGQVLLSSGESATVKGLEAIVDDDQFRILRAEEPKKVLIARPRDAVQWALYYPPVIDVRAGDTAHPSLRAAAEQFRSGNTVQALAELDRVPTDSWDAQYFIYRASLLLYVGREREAQTELTQALQRDDAKRSDVYALQTIIAIVQNDKDRGLQLAQRAVEADPTSSAAQIALSYAQQAIFKLDPALQSAEQAAKLDPDNALAYARIAELQLSQGDLDKALAAAKKATELNPNLARTQSILGFSYLTRIDTENAKATFAKAIQLDSSDPLPHLGLGLAKIREGKLAEGRQDIEQAVILDPNNSLIRSYVGKAYYEEKRDELAGKQFEIAKELDPNDPTPWFYDAIRKQTDNRPTEALLDLEESIKRNERRAVFRSKFSLDSDTAVRSTSSAQIFDDLEFTRLARQNASVALTLDPTNHAAHRFLSDVYNRLPRHEIARVSELLQAQLLQPVNAHVTQASAAASDFRATGQLTPLRAGITEYTQLFDRDRNHLFLSGTIGTDSTLSEEIALSHVQGRGSISFSQFHFETKGFRENADAKHDIYDLFGQLDVNPKLSLQGEVRRQRTTEGDLQLHFNRASFSSDERLARTRDSFRLGLRAHPTPSSTVIASLTHLDQTFDRIIPSIEGRGSTSDRGNELEGQYLYQGELASITAGVGGFRFKEREEFDDFFGGIPKTTTNVKQTTEYLYTTIRIPSPMTWTLGIARESLAASPLDIEKTNPKFGVTWDLNGRTKLRFAAFETLKRPIAANQTIEPTSIAGFNQLFDGSRGVMARARAAGVDSRIGSHTYWGMDWIERDLEFPVFGPTLIWEEQKETTISTYFNWLITDRLDLSFGINRDKFSRGDQIERTGQPNPRPIQVETTSVPISLRYFNPKGAFIGLTATNVRQSVSRRPPFSEIFGAGRDTFLLWDATIGFRSTKRRGEIELQVKNLSDEKFGYEDDSFRSPETGRWAYLPRRTVNVRATLAF